MAFKLTGKNFLKNCSEAVGVGGDPVQKEKPPSREQKLKSFRPSEKLDIRINELADQTGASYNSTVCLLVMLGLQSFNSDSQIQ